MSSFTGRTPSLRFYMPDAEAVSLVVDGWYESRPLKKDIEGFWSVKLHRPIQELDGQAYHFNVEHKGKVITITDPLAHRPRRHERWLKSYSYFLSHWTRTSIAINTLLLDTKPTSLNVAAPH